MQKEKFPWIKPSSTCNLKPYEWQSFADLLHKGITLRDAYAFLRDDDSLARHLEEGKDIKEVLLLGQKGKFYDHLEFFLRITSLADAIDAALRMREFEQNIRKKFVKQTSYPILLFAMAFMTLYFFSVFIIPQLMQSFDLNEGNQGLLWIANGLKYGAIFIFVVFVFFVVFIIVCMHQPSLHLQCGLGLSKFTTLPADFCSYTLAGYLIQLQAQGITSQSSFQFLVKLQKNTWFSHCVVEIQKQLENGIDIESVLQAQPFINHTFLKSWKIGAYTQQLSNSLEDFRKRQEDTWYRLIKTIGIIIQCSAYTFVALMVLLVYQIMLVPLQILETM